MNLVPFEPKLNVPNTEQELKLRFLDILQDTLLVKAACDQMHISEQKAYSWRRLDNEFSMNWDRIMGAVLPHLEAEALRRALAGSDPLLMFMLKAANRAKYDDAVARNTTTSQGVTIRLVDAKKRGETG